MSAKGRLDKIEREYDPDHDLGPDAPVHWSVAELVEVCREQSQQIEELQNLATAQKHVINGLTSQVVTLVERLGGVAALGRQVQQTEDVMLNLAQQVGGIETWIEEHDAGEALAESVALYKEAPRA